jgi:hypothetical protein
MTTHHGDSPLDAEANWTKVTAYAAKNKEPTPKTGKENEKNLQIEAQEGKNEASGTGTNAPRRNDSNYVTRINFKVIPDKNTKTISVFHSINRILAATKTIDSTTRIIATDKDGNETEYIGADQPNMPRNQEEVRAYMNQFVEEPRMTTRNELVGLITMRSYVNFRAIKKSPAVQQELNEYPRIFLTPNYLSVVTPVLVGFFTNNYPRPDMPETFQDRTNNFIRSYDPEIMYQLDYGPIWAKNRKMSVFKLMTSLDKKEDLRTLMEYYAKTNEDTEYVCAAEFYSLSDEGKLKIIMHQVDFCTNTKSIFIHGYKDIDVPLRIDAKEEDVEGNQTLATWLHARHTSYGQKMFTRIYHPTNGTIELYTPAKNHKEAIDWARLSTSEIAKELNDKSMEAIFTNPKDAYDKMAVQPDWKPHTLAKRIEQLVTPEKVKNQNRRRQVAMSYATDDTKVEEEKKNNRNKQWNEKNKNKDKGTSDEKNNKTPVAETPNAWNPPERTITMTATTTQDEEGVEETQNINLPKFGINKYKAAAAAQDKRMQKIEANLEIMIKLQQQTQTEMQEEMKDLKNHQTGTKAVLEAVVESCSKNRQQLEDHKKDTDNRLQKFRESLLLLDLAMDKPSSTESPRRKNPRPTLPPEETSMSVDDNSDEESDGNAQPKQTPAPKSDDQTRVAAGGN